MAADPVRQWLKDNDVYDKDLHNLLPKYGVNDPAKDLKTLTPKKWKAIERQILTTRQKDLKSNKAKRTLEKKLTKVKKLWEEARPKKKSKQPALLPLFDGIITDNDKAYSPQSPGTQNELNGHSSPTKAAKTPKSPKTPKTPKSPKKPKTPKTPNKAQESENNDEDNKDINANEVNDEPKSDANEASVAKDEKEKEKHESNENEETNEDNNDEPKTDENEVDNKADANEEKDDENKVSDEVVEQNGYKPADKEQEETEKKAAKDNNEQSMDLDVTDVSQKSAENIVDSSEPAEQQNGAQNDDDDNKDDNDEKKDDDEESVDIGIEDEEEEETWDRYDDLKLKENEITDVDDSGMLLVPLQALKTQGSVVDMLMDDDMDEKGDDAQENSIVISLAPQTNGKQSQNKKQQKITVSLEADIFTYDEQTKTYSVTLSKCQLMRSDYKRKQIVFEIHEDKVNKFKSDKPDKHLDDQYIDEVLDEIHNSDK